MEQWQFLIQKQGDRSWHNLESPNLEISEGRYRVLARSHLPNTDVEIRVIYYSTQETPPKRRIQKRCGETNAEGLLAVIPFTYLKPGVWELQCCGDLISHLVCQSWEYGIRLQVTPEKSARVWEQWHTGEHIGANLGANLGANSPHGLDPVFDGNVKPITALETQPNLNITSDTATNSTVAYQPVSMAAPKSETAKEILENLMDLAVPNSSTFLDDSKVEDDVVITPRLPLSLILDKETHIARWGEKTVIHGQVKLQEQTSAENLYALELVIELRSPLRSEILTQVSRPLPNASLPMTIKATVDIPVDCESKLILADINLYGAFSQLDEVALLASNSFTITADVTELLAVTASPRLTQQDLLDQPTAPPTPPQPPLNIDLELFNLAKTAPRNSAQLIQTSPLNRKQPTAAPIQGSKTNKSANSRLPKLPKLPAKENTDITESSRNEQSLEQNKTKATINLEQLVIKNHPVRMFKNTFPHLKPLTVVPENTADPLSLQNAEDSPRQDTTVSEYEHTPELLVSDAQSLNNSVAELSVTPNVESNVEAHLQSSPLIKKWMQRQGYSLPESMIEVVDTQEIADVETLLETDNDTSTANATTITEVEQIETDRSAEIGLPCLDSQSPLTDELITSSPWWTQEFVVEDIYPQSTEDLIDSDSSQPQQPTSDVSNILPVQQEIVEPLPIPQLHLPSGELIAGTYVTVRVELPTVSPQVVIKLWMEDCQTRWLLDSPHVLTNLRPNPLGNVEVMTQLNIPFGCLEVRLEAIAFNQLTEQESRKVSVVRTVIPPDLPNLQLDELLGLC